MKKIILPILVMLLSLILVTPTFASQVSEKADQELERLTQGKGEIIYMDDEITVRSFGNDPEISDAIVNHPNNVVENENTITPFASNIKIGSGGRASIVAGDSGRILYWDIAPATLWPYSFAGFVKLRYHSGFKRDVPISGAGLAGISTSGIVTMNKNNGGVAYLSGTAYSLTGGQYKVLPGVHVSFRPN